ncbi:hypothetical protein Emag_004798 [Eimeria magna]
MTSGDSLEETLPQKVCGRDVRRHTHNRPPAAEEAAERSISGQTILYWGLRGPQETFAAWVAHARVKSSNRQRDTASGDSLKRRCFGAICFANSNEGVRHRGGLAPSAFYPANADPASSSPSMVVEEGLPEILERYAVGPRAPVPRPAAARRISLILLSSIGAAVAFLLATCFRRLRSRGPAEGLQVRSLAGQERWGGAAEEDGDEEDFLSQALEGCLDLEVELGFAEPAPRPLPPTENDAVKSIVFSLKEAAMMFETQQASDGFLETSLPSTPQEAPQPLGLTAQADDQGTRQRTEAWQEGAGPSGAPLASVPTPPMPSHNGLQGVPTSDELVYLQQQQRGPSSEAAAAAEGRVASRPPFPANEEEAEQPPSKKARGHLGEAVSRFSLYTLLVEPPRRELQQQQKSLPRLLPAETRAHGPSKQSGLFASFPGAFFSSNEAASAAEAFLAAGPSASPQALTSGQTPKSSANSRSASLQPGGLEVVEGSMSIVLQTGEKITFPHPPIPTPPDTPLHYRLPLVPPEALQTHFLTNVALSSYCCASVWPPLVVIRTQLRKPALDAVDVTQVIAACQQVLKYLLTKHTGLVTLLHASKAVERLSIRYLCLEALVTCIQLLGPSMRPEEWFGQLVTEIPIKFRLTSIHRSPAAWFNTKLLWLLTEALIQLKAGKRPSLELTESIKKKLFSRKTAPPFFRPQYWDPWRPDFEEDA